MENGTSEAAGVNTMSPLDEIRNLLPLVEHEGAESTWESLRRRITILNSALWEDRVSWPLVERWLENFDGRSGHSCEVERLHALYVLAQFLYYGSTEIRVLLRAQYRDLFLIPLIQEVRKGSGDTRNLDVIRARLSEELSRTRFLGVGNPSESGVHLLYFFRQENGLTKSIFLDNAQITERFVDAGGVVSRQLQDPTIRRYIFLDDVCGSGDTALKYSRNILQDIRSIDPDIEFSYFSIFGTASGMSNVRTNTLFNSQSAALIELDASYRCLSNDSRYLRVVPEHISEATVREVALHYGALLAPGHAGGFEDSQMLFGFHHNTPDNTLPIIWREVSNGSPIPWTPIFRRYPKI